MFQDKYKDCLSYIDSYWEKIIIRPKRAKGFKKLLLLRTKDTMREATNAIDIPYAFLVPNDKRFIHVFYWDSFFMFKGLIRTANEWVLKDMVNNFAYLYKKYHIIPNFSSFAATGRSQPPLLTSMILDTYNVYYFKHVKRNGFKKLFLSMRRHNKWLKKVVAFAKQEYWNIWMDEKKLYYHSVEGYKLSRYGDRDAGFAHSSELESGWDMTSRFFNRCNEFLPVDLNAFLFKYERDFVKMAHHLRDKKDEEYWRGRAKERAREINDYMWNEKEGFFYDYDYVHKRQSDFLSLAGFIPLWTGLATGEQAKKMIRKLPHFETKYGLFITARESLPPSINLGKVPENYRLGLEEFLRPKQWDYPHIWPPLEYLTVIGLLKYKYIKEAKEIMKKSLEAQAHVFRKHGMFFEKIDGVKGDKSSGFHYPNQGGFGWTNAAFYRYVQILDHLEKNGDNSIYNPEQTTPPFTISIPH